ncbi:MAG: alpha/beta hydrolase [Pirellulaceae bacterium]
MLAHHPFDGIHRRSHTLMQALTIALALVAVGCSQQADRHERSESQVDAVANEDYPYDSAYDAPAYAESAVEPALAEESPPPGVARESSSYANESPSFVERPFSATELQNMAAPRPAPAQSMQMRQADASAMQASPSLSAPRDATMSSLPAGARHEAEADFATVEVFYATDRKGSDVPLSAYRVSGQQTIMTTLLGVSVMLGFIGLYYLSTRRGTMGAASMIAACLTAFLAAACVGLGQANIEKHGVTYTAERGALVRGVCEVTVPDSHQRGAVESPSLLRFELREDQSKHIVLTSAVELAPSDFQQRLAERVAGSPQGDLLVFIHGYNVDFESAVRRTAQIAVDLPFEGVPVCYSWPSQGTLMGYTIDENNSEWTIYHLKDFLLELIQESGARSINVVAHSMGNRAMTAAMQQIRWELEPEAPPAFDRVVLAAPDVDADRFRRDLAPILLQVAEQVTLYASSDDQALIASKQVHGYPRAGESGSQIVVVPGIETVDVSGIDLSLLGHSYYGDNEMMLRELYEVVRQGLRAPQRAMLIERQAGDHIYWQLAQRGQMLTR